MRWLAAALAVVTITGTLVATPAGAGPDPVTKGFDGGDGDNAWVDNGNQYWELDADTGVARHHNKRQDRWNTMTVADFLDVWYAEVGGEPGTGHLSAQLDCAPGTPDRRYFTRGFVTRSLAWADGVAVALEAPAGVVEDRVAQAGGAAYVFQGTWQTYGALTNATMRAFEGGAVSSDTDAAVVGNTFELSWTPTAGGYTVGADGRIWATAATAAGHGNGRCAGVWGTYPAVATANAMIWYTSGVTARADIS